MLTIAPCAFLSAGAAACARNSGARRLVPIRSSHASGVIAPTGVGKNDDALLTMRVETAERLQRLLDHRRQLVEVEEVGLDQRDRIGAHAVELGLQQPRFARGSAVVEHEVRARRMQPAADRGADALAASGDQHDPALHAAPPGIHVRLDLNLAHRSCRRTRRRCRRRAFALHVVTDLPEPDAAARAHSERVTAHIRAAIASSAGRIAFSRYMDLALYAPGLGYYAAGATKLGAAGDFVTAPEMTPLFATALATQVAAILDATQRREIVELGGGSGRLAADLSARARGARCAAVALCDPRGRVRICAARQRETLERRRPGASRARDMDRRAAGGDRRRGDRERSARCRARALDRAPRRRVARARRQLEGGTECLGGRRARRLRVGRRSARRAPRGARGGALSAATATTRARSTRPRKRSSKTSAGA